MVRIRITEKGVITEPGDPAPVEFAGGQQPSIAPPPLTNVTADATAASGQGVYVVSSSTGGNITLTFPAASAAAGSFIHVRNASAGSSHVLTSSADDAGTSVFRDGTSSGGSLTIDSLLDSSAVLTSDGVHWMVAVASGSLVLAGS